MKLDNRTQYNTHHLKAIVLKVLRVYLHATAISKMEIVVHPAGGNGPAVWKASRGFHLIDIRMCPSKALFAKRLAEACFSYTYGQNKAYDFSTFMWADDMPLDLKPVEDPLVTATKRALKKVEDIRRQHRHIISKAEEWERKLDTARSYMLRWRKEQERFERKNAEWLDQDKQQEKGNGRQRKSTASSRDHGTPSLVRR